MNPSDGPVPHEELARLLRELALGGQGAGGDEAQKLLRDLAALSRAGGGPAGTVASAFGVPVRLGSFTLIERIGAGGMGEVYAARQASLERTVALKVLSPHVARDGGALERFLQEARIVAGLEHPAIVPVYETGIEGGYPYIAMQLVQGMSLDAMLRDGQPLTVVRALEVTRDIARALEAAHGQGVVHRDVKPANILLEGKASAARGEGKVYLVDFGLARLWEGESITQTGEVLGTPSFMSPEQAMGKATGRRSDIYSLGATLYAMLSGHALHEGTSYPEVLQKVVKKTPRRVIGLNPKVDRDAAVICEKAMRWEVGSRYATAGELAEDIERRLAYKPIRARRASVFYRVRLKCRRNPQAVWALAAAVVVVFAVLGVWVGLRYRGEVTRVAELIGAGEVEQARVRLESYGYVPEFIRMERDRELWVELLLHEGDLAGAAGAAGVLSDDRGVRRVEGIVRRRLKQALRLAGNDAWEAGLELVREVTNVVGRMVGRRALVQEFYDTALVVLNAGRLWEMVGEVDAGGVDGFLERVAAEKWGPRGAGRTPIETILADVQADRSEEGRGLRRRGAQRLLDSAGARLKIAGLNEQSRWAALIRYLLADAHREVLPGAALDATNENWIWLLERLGDFRGTALAIPPWTWAVGDLEGDGQLEVVVGHRPEFAAESVQVYTVGDEQMTRIDVAGQALKKAGNPKYALVLRDLDGKSGDELLGCFPVPSSPIVVYDLLTFRLDGGKLVPYPLETKGPYRGCVEPGGMLVVDLDDDTGPEIVFGLGPREDGERQRETRVISCRRDGSFAEYVLPQDEATRSDVRGVCCGNFDGEPGLEIAAAVGPWRGYDLRIWKFTENGFVGPLRIGPMASPLKAIAVPVLEPGGSGRQTIFFSGSSRDFQRANKLPGFDTWCGIPLGIYEYALPAGASVEDRTVAVAPERWRDTVTLRVPFDHASFSREWPEKPVEALEPNLPMCEGDVLSSVRTDGVLVLGDRWLVEAGDVHSAVMDLHVRRETKGGFTHHRLFTEQGEARSMGSLFSCGEKDAQQGLLLYREPQRGMTEGSLRFWRFRERPERGARGLAAQAVLEAAIRRGEEESAMKRAREIVEGFQGVDRLWILTRWAEAAERACAWDELKEAVARYDKAGGAGAPLEVRRTFDELSRAVGADARARRVHGGRTTFRTGLPSAPRGPNVQEVDLATIRVDAAATGAALSFSVTLESFPFGRHFFIGLVPPGMPWTGDGYGIRLLCGGGGDDIYRVVCLEWGGSSTIIDNEFILPRLEEGATYDFRIERAPTGLVCLTITGRGVEKSARRVLLPLSRREGALEDAYRRTARREAPLPAQTYSFGLRNSTGASGSGETRDPVKLEISNVELEVGS